MKPCNLIDSEDDTGGGPDAPLFIQAALKALIAAFEQEFNQKGM
jgi:hypothetical protein